jgi:hypothetical protein
MITVAPNVTKIAVEVSGFPETVVTVTPVVQPVTVTPVFTVAEGPPGKSSYQLWLDAGNVGTEEEFLASGGITAGPGFRIVGSELRYNISSLTRG